MLTTAGAKGRALLVVLALAMSGCSCEGSRRDVESLPDLGYPTCEGQPLPEGERIGAGVLRSGPTMRQHDVVERFELRRRGCVTVARSEQEWRLGTADVEAVFDADLRPLRIWKHTTLPDASGPLGHRDVRVFELRTSPIGLTRRTPAGALERFELRGARPEAVIGPGRGLLSIWLMRAHLAEGGRVRQPVLDVREPLAVIRDVTLQRLSDQEIEGLGRVRVYTIYGSEPIFADDHDVVIGDMLGLRPADSVPGSLPDPMPDGGPLDPTRMP